MKIATRLARQWSPHPVRLPEYLRREMAVRDPAACGHYRSIRKQRVLQRVRKFHLPWSKVCLQLRGGRRLTIDTWWTLRQHSRRRRHRSRHLSARHFYHPRRRQRCRMAHGFVQSRANRRQCKDYSHPVPSGLQRKSRLQCLTSFASRRAAVQLPRRVARHPASQRPLQLHCQR